MNDNGQVTHGTWATANRAKASLGRTLLAIIAFCGATTASMGQQMAWSLALEPGEYLYKPTVRQLVGMRDGGVLVGRDESTNNQDRNQIYIAKYSSSGALLWQRRIHGLYAALFTYMRELPNGTILCLGNEQYLPSNDNTKRYHWRAFAFGLSADGDSLWTRSYISPFSGPGMRNEFLVGANTSEAMTLAVGRDSNYVYTFYLDSLGENRQTNKNLPAYYGVQSVRKRAENVFDMYMPEDQIIELTRVDSTGARLGGGHGLRVKFAGEKQVVSGTATMFPVGYRDNLIICNTLGDSLKTGNTSLLFARVDSLGYALGDTVWVWNPYPAFSKSIILDKTQPFGNQQYLLCTSRQGALLIFDAVAMKIREIRIPDTWRMRNAVDLGNGRIGLYATETTELKPMLAVIDGVTTGIQERALNVTLPFRLW